MNHANQAPDTDSRTVTPSRRQFLGGVALAATGALAGCTGETPPLEPALPEQRLDSDGWSLRDTVEDTTTQTVTFAGTEQSVEIHSITEIYGNDRPLKTAEANLDASLGDVQLPPAQFVAAKAETDPPVTQLLGLSNSALDRFVNRAEAQAKSRLRSQGVQNIRRVSQEQLDIDAADTAEHRTYKADFPYEGTTVTRSGQEVTVQSGTFTVEAQLAVWPYSGLLATTAGVYPGESGTFTVEARGTTTQVSLGLRPEQYRESVRALTVGME